MRAKRDRAEGKYFVRVFTLEYSRLDSFGNHNLTLHSFDLDSVSRVSSRLDDMTRRLRFLARMEEERGAAVTKNLYKRISATVGNLELNFKR